MELLQEGDKKEEKEEEKAEEKKEENTEEEGKEKKKEQENKDEEKAEKDEENTNNNSLPKEVKLCRFSPYRETVKMHPDPSNNIIFNYKLYSYLTEQ